MRPELDALNIAMVAVSPDTPREAKRMKDRLGLNMTVVGDDKLRVIDLYKVRHDKGIAPNHGVFRPLAIPTAFLFNERGELCWFDQTDNYRLRSDARRVIGQVKEALGLTAS